MSFVKQRFFFSIIGLAGLALASPAPAQSGPGCAGAYSPAPSLPFPQYSDGPASPRVVAGNKYVYALTRLGYTRTNISNPDTPGIPQLCNIAHDPGSPNDGGRLLWNCDCHNMGTTLAVAEEPSGDSRLITDWNPYSQNPVAALAGQSGRGLGANFEFAQQININQISPTVGAQLGIIYAPETGKYFGYFPTSNGSSSLVQIVDLTTTSGQTGQISCPPSPCPRTPASAGLQPLPQTLAWSVFGLWAGSATLGSQSKYVLVGAGGGALNVAFLDPGTGVPTVVGSAPFSSAPQGLAVASVNGRIFLFSAEQSLGLQIYEVTATSVVSVPQPAAFQAATGFVISGVVVKGPPGSGLPGSPTPPLIFLHREGSFPSQIEVWDTAWLKNGQQPRQGASFNHLGYRFPDNSFVNYKGFDAKVTQSGSVVSAYLFQVVYKAAGNTYQQDSVMSTKKDVSCIAADPTAPPVASFTMTNLTAQAQTRVGTNYYGDRWTIQDTTSTGVSLTGLEWDLIAPDTSTTSIATDASVSFPGPGTVPPSVSTLTNLIWPCDPALAGDPATGAGCFASLGASAAGASNPHNIKNRATNVNPPPNIYAKTPTPIVQKPTAYVNGQTGTGVAVQVLSGAGVLNALGSPSTQGNTAEATFNWVLTGCSGGCAAVPSAPSANVPNGATGFSLTVAYKDGFTSPAVSGTIQQRDLIPAFTLSPATVLTSAPITLTNRMQIGSATINFVHYDISGPSPSNGTLSGSFNTVNGTVQITAPATAGSYTITLTYNYNGPTDGNNAQQTTPSQPFTVTTFNPAPQVAFWRDSGATTPVTFFPPPSLVINTTYYVQDAETVPPSVGHPGAQYFFGTNISSLPSTPGTGAETLIGTGPAVSPGTATPTVPFTRTAVCASGCYVRAQVQGILSPPAAVTIVSNVQPLGVTVNGPTTGAVNAALQYGANATGGTPPYAYAWDCQFNALGPNFQSGTVFQNCTYTAGGTYNVAVQVTDSASPAHVVISSPRQVSIGGGGGGGLGVVITGPATASAGSPVTFNATASGGSGSYQFTWYPTGSFISTNTGATPSFTYTYSTAGSYTVLCTVMSGSASAQDSRAITITPSTGPPAPTAAYSVQGATLNSLTGTYDAEGGATITFNAQEVPANVAPNGYTWDFSDGSPRHGQQVAYVFSGAGSKTVQLTVAGDGTNRSGTASVAIQLSIHAPSFQALLVASAEHQPVPLTNDQKFFRTDVVVANPGTAPVTISPSYLDFSATTGINVFDLSTVTFDPAKRVTIPPKGEWNQADVVKYLNGDASTKGTLVLRYEGGDATPLVTSRVYATPTADPLGPSAGSALAAVRATKDGQVIPNGGAPAELRLPGLRSDSAYYFRLSLVNSAGITGVFRLTAVDQDGSAVTLKDPRPGGVPGPNVDFIVNPYGGVDWSGDDLGLNDPSKRYVLKVSKAPGYTTGRPMAFAKLNDRVTGDPSLITPAAPPEYRESCAGSQTCVNYVMPGVSRYPTPEGARWKTSIAIYNPSQYYPRGLGLTYSYSPTSLQPPEQVAQSFYILGPGKMAYWDDIVGQVFATPENHLGDLANGTAGIVRIEHFVDGETTTAPLLITARNYDDQPTGTVGSQLTAYTRPISVGPGEAPLLLTGLQQDDSTNPRPRFWSTVNVFAYDDVQTDVLLTALKSDGTVLGTHHVVLNQPFVNGQGQPLVTGHFQPRSLGANDATGNLNGVQNEPISVKIEVVQGGRVGAYGIIEDVTTRDPTYVQAIPQN